AALDPAERLSLHQLAQQLDQCQDELRQALLEVVAVGVDAAAQRPIQAIELIAEEAEVWVAGEQLVAAWALVVARRPPHSPSPELKLLGGEGLVQALVASSSSEARPRTRPP